MLPVTLLIVESDPDIQQTISSELQNLSGILISGVAGTADGAFHFVREQKQNIIILDVELPDMKGIQLAEKLKEMNPDLYIIFLADNEEYAYDAFRIYAYDYIIKPTVKERILATVRRIQCTIHRTSVFPVCRPPARISVHTKNERVFIRLSDIFYFEKSSRYTIIHTVKGRFRTRDTLHNFEKRLGPLYYRSHRSFIINTEHVERIMSFPGSSYHEIKFINYDKRAMLSRDRIHDLCNLLESI